MTTDTNTTAHRDANRLLDQITHTLLGHVDLDGCMTAQDIIDAVHRDDAAGMLDEALAGDGGHDPTLLTWLTERGDDITSAIARQEQGEPEHKTHEFAAACYSTNSVRELGLALNTGPDAPDCAEWNLTHDHWRVAVEAALYCLEHDDLDLDEEVDRIAKRRGVTL